MSNLSGVYKIISKVHPERIYIGSAFCLRKRWVEHKGDFRRGNHKNGKLQRHYNKYSLEDFEFVILEKFEFTTNDYLLAREQYYIDTLRPWFNICPKAGNRLGSKNQRPKPPLSPEALAKMKASLKGREVWNKGKRFSKQSRDKMAKSKIGNSNAQGSVRTQEMRDKVGDFFRGKKLSAEHIIKIGIASGLRKQKDAAKLKISIANKGRNLGKKLVYNIYTKKQSLVKPHLHPITYPPQNIITK